ncbi:hypothetical protein PVK06_046913 [Gossypium arboreum]|uniref:Uncharacterized protein n=1 Tax=Gossypium arboreum TaxID=29729 RepID=A0ABR0MCC4_GOSAR|nr:hypothetical protein PVK06_046913 [Gossypium arboreum]
MVGVRITTNPDPYLQIHPEVIISTKTDVGERTNNGEDSNQDVKDFSDPDVDEVLDNINDEGLEEVEDVHDPSFSNPSHDIVLQNEPGAGMLNVDSDATHASEFPEYADIVPAHKLTSYSQLKELFVGQRFENKVDCIYSPLLLAPENQ